MKTSIFLMLALVFSACTVPALAVAADAPAVKASAPAGVIKKKTAPTVKQMNINTATAQELMTLPGIGEAEAKSIIAGRPYGSKGMLVSKKALTEDKALAIRELVFAGKPVKGTAKK